MIASHKGRNAVGWFFGGLFLDVIGIIIVAVIANLKEQRARYQGALSERRRLREQLNIEKMRNQQFRGQAGQRLDMHDRAIGVDTRPSDAPMPEPASPILVPSAEPPPIKKSPEWYYATDGGERVGPLQFVEFASHYRAGRFGPTSFVWSFGWPDWRELREVSGLEEKLEG